MVSVQRCHAHRLQSKRAKQTCLHTQVSVYVYVCAGVDLRVHLCVGDGPVCLCVYNCWVHLQVSERCKSSVNKLSPQEHRGKCLI